MMVVRAVGRREFLGRAIALAPVLALPASCDDGLRVARLRGATMGTTWNVTIPDRISDAAGLRARIGALLDDLDAKMSTWKPDSEISRFNRSGSTAWFPVSPATAAVVAEARRVAGLTGGAFDITVGPAVDLWGFGGGKAPKRYPDAAAISAVRAGVGFRAIEVRANALRKHVPELRIDLSAIAKGYAVDRVAALLGAVGMADYMVEIGGEVRCSGRNDRGLPWSIAVERPEPGRREPFRVLHLTHGGLATSGDYRRFLTRDGKRYAHIIDPRSLHPVTHGLGSVTVHAKTAMRADALATGLFVLGPIHGVELARRKDIAALFLARQGARITEISTPEFIRRRLAEGGALWNIS